MWFVKTKRKTKISASSVSHVLLSLFVLSINGTKTKTKIIAFSMSRVLLRLVGWFLVKRRLVGWLVGWWDGCVCLFSFVGCLVVWQ